MSLDSALRDVQVTRNLGVVTPLQQEIDDLLFARCHGAGYLLHHLYLIKAAPDAESGIIGALTQLELWPLAQTSVHARGQLKGLRLTRCEKAYAKAILD
ncbi:MAG: hypothetical protein WAL71_17770 [Terriglobales bacterium]